MGSVTEIGVEGMRELVGVLRQQQDQAVDAVPAYFGEGNPASWKDNRCASRSACRPAEGSSGVVVVDGSTSVDMVLRSNAV